MNHKSIVVDNNNTKWFGSHLGITSFDGTMWKKYKPDWWVFGTSYDSDVVNSLAFDNDGILWAGTNKGLFKFYPTSTDVKENDNLPKVISLKENYPNPFNSSTIIEFIIPSSGSASLSVYSLTGQHIRTLVSGAQPTGTHSVVWDGRDDSGRPVSSGVYFSVLTAGKQTATSKMLLLR